MRKTKYYDTEQVIKDNIDYWMDLIQEELGTYTDLDRVKLIVRELRDKDLLRWLSIKNTGIYAYVISDDMLGGKCLSELMFYIRPEHRGDIRLVNKYIRDIERIAKDKNCKCVKVGANIGFKDQAFIKLLERKGYVVDTVAKYI